MFNYKVGNAMSNYKANKTNIGTIYLSLYKVKMIH